MNLKKSDLNLIKSFKYLPKEENRLNTDCIEITANILDHHNDYIQIYLYENDGRYVITDDCFVFNELKGSNYLVSWININEKRYYISDNHILQYVTGFKDMLPYWILMMISGIKSVCNKIEEAG